MPIYSTLYTGMGYRLGVISAKWTSRTQTNTMNPLFVLLYWNILTRTIFAEDQGEQKIVTPTYVNASDLHDSVLKGYNKHVRPVENQYTPTYVGIVFSLLSVNDVDAVGGILSFSSFITASWMDEMIRWDGSLTGLYHFMLPFDLVWTPNLVISNPGGQMKKIGDDYAHVRYIHDGTAIWTPPIIMKTTCGIDITLFPFDSQTCVIYMNSWMTIPSEVTLFAAHREGDMTYYQENGEWDMESVSIAEVGGSVLKISIKLKRKPIFLVVNIILPIVFLGIINPLVFILPVECGERISYAITVLLSFAVFLTLVSDRLPESSEPQALLSFYLLLALVYSVVILVITVLTLRLYFKEDNEPVPKYVRRIMMVLSFRVCRRTPSSVGPDVKDQQCSQTVASDRKETIDDGLDNGNMDHFDNWKNVAKSIDFIVFVSGLVIFVVATIGFLTILGTTSNGDQDSD